MIIVKVAEKTVRDAGTSLLLCLGYQLLLVVAFSGTGIMFFGGYSKVTFSGNPTSNCIVLQLQSFKNFNSAFSTLLLLSMNLCGTFELDDLYKHPLGVAFYIFYMLFSFFFINIYIAIISLHYADSKDFYADEPRSVQKFVQEKWAFYKNLLMVRRKKLRGGEGNKQLVLFSSEHQFQCMGFIKKNL